MAHPDPTKAYVKRGRRIFLLYSYYWPHYKAGGPVQSLFNLTQFFRDEATFYVISLDKDLDGITPVALGKNKWLEGPNGEFVYFTSVLSPFLVFKLLSQVDPDIVFINGIFNGRTTLPGLIWARIKKRKVIISPRGMLQQWALRKRGWKKRVYLCLFKNCVGLQTVWHATDTQERDDVERLFGRYQQIHVAANIPRRVSDMSAIVYPDIDNKIRLVFLSLINKNKNLHLIIYAVNKFADYFTLDIYGPVIDKEYWKECERMILNPVSVAYKGPVPSWDVAKVLRGYHFFILPTAGENFGHAIFDALASGVPVVITRNTPWKDLDEFSAGMYLNINEPDALLETLDTILHMSSTDYQRYRHGSFTYAKQFWAERNYQSDYSFLFEDVEEEH